MKLSKISVLAILTLVSFTSSAESISVTQNSVFQRLLSLKEFKSGPNCWNAALQVQGIYPYTLLTSSLTAEKLFNESCTKIDATIAQAPRGSLIRYLEQGRDLHAFIKLDNNKFFQKRDAGALGPYQVTSLADIDRLYGPQENCTTDQDCSWSYEVLTCNPENVLRTANAQLHQVLNNFSEFVSTGDRSKQANILKALSYLDKNKKAFTRELFSDRGSTNFYYLVDLYQTNRFATDLDSASEADSAFSKSVDRHLWSIFEEIAFSEQLTEKYVNSIYDFAFAAKSANGNPSILINQILNISKKLNFEMTKDENTTLVSKVLLFANPNISFSNTEIAIHEAISKYIDRDAEDMMFYALTMYFLYSKSDFSEKNNFEIKFIRESITRKLNYDQAYDLTEILKKNKGLSSREKKSILSSIGDNLSSEYAERIKILFNK